MIKANMYKSQCTSFINSIINVFADLCSYSFENVLFMQETVYFGAIYDFTLRVNYVKEIFLQFKLNTFLITVLAESSHELFLVTELPLKHYLNILLNLFVLTLSSDFENIRHVLSLVNN